jgi:hypothetical protein
LHKENGWWKKRTSTAALSLVKLQIKARESIHLAFFFVPTM